MSRTRCGFTLLEVLVALVVGSVVLLVGYTALTSGLDTRDRLLRHRDRAEREARTTALLRDLLRHVVDAELIDDAPLALRRMTIAGADADSLIVVSRGVDAPQGAGRLWRVTLTADAKGVLVRAVPLLRADEPPTRLPPLLESRLEHLRGVRVQVLETPGAAWRDDWPQPVALPVAVAIRFIASDSSATGPALVVRLGAPGSA
ncbi:MAG: prepilin-type N-terminal cleavage/methylation domain-containing protein [Gemmatimonadaceae bacterium]|nr:prepilin-type N-terminal cleavage/methylation domain-containing protein [Gemmatimonadaceae bacterium]